jgi:ribose transport system ATP-binding protein
MEEEQTGLRRVPLESDTVYSLEVFHATKSFNDNEVLHDVNFNIKPGEVHGLVGQNGAGKSTLMKIINGVYTKDKGEIYVRGKRADYDSPKAASQYSIGMVFQEFSLIPSMTVAQNIFLSHEPRNGLLTDDAVANKRAAQIFDELEVIIDPHALVENLPVGEQQIVEIAKALSRNASILIMDEPTASLTSNEIESLFTIIRKLKKEGISIIFVSHHLNEVMDICDRITVLRDGKIVLSDITSTLTIEQVIAEMVGKKLAEKERHKKAIDLENPLLEIDRLGLGSKYRNIDLKLFQGEIVGIAGVMGSGRSEILKSIYGILKPDSGRFKMRGKTVSIRNPSDAIKNGIIYVPEDRRNNGVILGQSLYMNILLPVWKRITTALLINDRKGRKMADSFSEDLHIKATSIDQLMEHLSGGNQQKAVFAKCLAVEPTVMLLDDPTVGVDIGTKKEIANIIRMVAERGNGVILVSSEMEELLELCDRILILRQGEIIEELKDVKNVTEEFLLHIVQRKGNSIEQ